MTSEVWQDVLLADQNLHSLQRLHSPPQLDRLLKRLECEAMFEGGACGAGNSSCPCQAEMCSHTDIFSSPRLPMLLSVLSFWRLLQKGGAENLRFLDLSGAWNLAELFTCSALECLHRWAQVSMSMRHLPAFCEAVEP